MTASLSRATLFLAMALFAAPAAAQPAAPKDTSTANTLAKDAKDRFDKQEFAEAYVLFESAERKAHSPVLVLYMARCQRQLSKLLASRDLYRKAAGEVLDAKSPAPFKTAVEDAKRELAELEPQIPRVIVLAPDFPPGTELTLDGAPVSESAAAAGVQVDPGPHKAVAKSGDQILATVEVTAELMKSVTATLTRPAPPPSAPSPKLTTEPQPPPDVSGGGSYVPGAIVLSIGVAALGAGVGTRVAAFGLVDDVRSRCVDDHCLPADEEDIDQAVTLQTVSTVCLVVGGAAAATGIVLLAVRPGGGGSPTVSLDVGPSRLLLRGSF